MKSETTPDVDNSIPVTDNNILMANQQIVIANLLIPVIGQSITVKNLLISVVNYSSCEEKPSFKTNIFFRLFGHPNCESNYAMLDWPVANFLCWEEDDPARETINRGLWHWFEWPPDKARDQNIWDRNLSAT